MTTLPRTEVTNVRRSSSLSSRMRFVLTTASYMRPARTRALATEFFRHALRHGVRLMPNNVLSEIPTIGLQRQGDTPWNSDEVFIFQSVAMIGVLEQRAILSRSVCIFVLLPCPSAAASIRRLSVAVAKIKPQRPILPKHAADFRNSSTIRETCPAFSQARAALLRRSLEGPNRAEKLHTFARFATAKFSRW
jgi:hypothetical protein